MTDLHPAEIYDSGEESCLAYVVRERACPLGTGVASGDEAKAQRRQDAPADGQAGGTA